MVKKIFSKMTRERREEYQIETYVYLENGKKRVAKRAMSEASIPHIQNMYQNYERYQNWNIPLLAKCELNQNGDTVIFDYIEGTNIGEQLLKAVKKEDRTKFIELLLEHKRLIEMTVGDRKESFAQSQAFVEAFGNHEELNGQMAAPYLNIDMTFDNIIEQEDGSHVAIDHEWIFDFPIPINFVFFRAIYLFYGRLYKELSPFISVEAIYDVFGIKGQDLETYRQMDAAFMMYAYGGECGYHGLLKGYQKASYEVRIDTSQHFAQIYFDDGNNFSEENSRVIPLENSMDCYEIQVFVPTGKTIQAVRFDPMECPGIVTIEQVSMADKDGNETEVTCVPVNSIYTKGNMAYFDKDDPQYQLFFEKHEVESFIFRYRVEFADMTYISHMVQSINELRIEKEAVVAEKEAIIAEIERKKHVKRALKALNIINEDK